ncbi:hypothetical protein ACVWZA_001502 [Sphingomonas sp. UYAg733]
MPPYYANTLLHCEVSAFKIDAVQLFFNLRAVEAASNQAPTLAANAHRRQSAPAGQAPAVTRIIHPATNASGRVATSGIDVVRGQIGQCGIAKIELPPVHHRMQQRAVHQRFEPKQQWGYPQTARIACKLMRKR